MRNDINPWLSRIGLGLIFCYCLLASIFFSYFAQIHLSFNFLPFPIFVGEIVMFICIPLLIWVCKDDQSLNRRTMLYLGLYFSWVVIKSIINYYFDGPLTCRNAALFYYPIFAVFTYVFYQKATLSRDVLIALAFLVAAILFFNVINTWYWWTYVTVFIIAVWNIKHDQWRCFGWVILAVLLWLGKEYFYQGSRAHFVSMFCAVVFLGSYLGVLFIKRREYLYLSILFTGLLFFILGFFVFSEHNARTSVTSFSGMVNSYKEFDKLYKEQQGNFVPRKLSVHLYNPKKFKTLFSPSLCPISQVKIPAPVATSSQNIGNPALPGWMKNIMGNDAVYNRLRRERVLALEESNIVFRLFVWRDMIHELFRERAWWGFSFGHPQRSRSLEVLNWAEGEWARDGWITPHNSFLHIIYRAGILGIFLIGFLFFMVGRLVRDFFNLNSIVGGLLVGALVYWFALSNFFVILEFPYNAIVIWSLFGITLAYRDGLKEKAGK